MSEKEIENSKQQALDKEEKENEQIREMGELTLDQNVKRHRIELLTIIGEVEGHDAAPSQSKTTKYEHVLPKLAMIEDDENVEGLLILLNTVGGWYLVAGIQSEYRWQCRQIILLLCQVPRW